MTLLSLQSNVVRSSVLDPLTLTATLKNFSEGLVNTNGDPVTFYNSSAPIGTGTLTNGVATLATLLRGGEIYVHAVGNTGNSISVLLGLGNGQFGPEQVIWLGYVQTFLVLSDLNGDGVPDLIYSFANESFGETTSIGVLFGNGDGTFKSPVYIDVQAAGRLAVGDLNGDGIPDIAAVVYNGVQVLLGSGDGSFRNGGVFVGDVNVSGIVTNIVIYDFNHDGTPDLVFKNEDFLVKMQGKGNGTFFAGEKVAYDDPQLAPLFSTKADLNGDGVADFVTLDLIELGGYLPYVDLYGWSATAVLKEISAGGSGNHQIVARYQGDAHNPPNGSNPVTIAAGK